MLYAALEQYDSDSIIEIKNSPEIDGVVQIPAHLTTHSAKS